MLKQLMAVIAIWVIAFTAQANDAKKIVQETTKSVFAAIEQDRQKIDQDKTHLYGLVEKIVLPHFDFNKMSRKVVDKATWKSSDRTQKQAFVTAFKNYLVRTYSTALIKFDIEKITYGKPRKAGRSVLVRTMVHLKRTSPVPIQYKLYKNKKKQWKVTDIVVNGISLITNRQGTYRRIAKQKGLAGLIDTLTKKNKG